MEISEKFFQIIFSFFTPKTTTTKTLKSNLTIKQFNPFYLIDV